MRNWIWIGFFGLLCSCGQAPQTAAPTMTASVAAGDIPFQLALDGFSIAGVPGLHSYVMAGTADKLVLFGRVRTALADGGIAVFGDLMFTNAPERERLLASRHPDHAR